MRIARAEGEAATDESGGIALTRDVETLSDGDEIGGGRTVAEPDHGEDLPVGLEILPGAGRRAAEDELEAERSGLPGLVGEGRLLVLGVEGADGGEGDGVVAEEHGVVVPEKRRRDGADREDGDPDDGQSLDADVRFHGDEIRGRGRIRVRECAPDLMGRGETGMRKVSERGMFGNEF